MNNVQTFDSNQKKRPKPNSTVSTPEASKKRPRNGNYQHYYVRRHERGGSGTDDRLPLIFRVLEGYPRTYLTVLDIGCNDGLLTMEVAKHGRCACMTGMDLDFSLIQRARKGIRHAALARQEELNTEKDDRDPMVVSLRVVQGRLPARVEVENGETETGGEDEVEKAEVFPYNIMFRHENIAAEEQGRSSMEKDHYDIVLCLSVTKWVHVSDGDVGLRRLFSRIRDVLKPGGCLVLEPQLKPSYKLARQKGLARKEMNFSEELKMHPEKFSDYLLSEEGGFERMEMLRDLREKGQAFNRPMMAFYKKENSSL